MAVHIAWDNDEKTTVRYDFEGHWTWQEFSAAAADAFAMTRSVTHRVDTISYFRPGTSLPPSAMLHFRQAMVNAPENRGVNMIVGGPMFIKTMVRFFIRANRSLGERLMLADNLDEARKLLAERRKRE